MASCTVIVFIVLAKYLFMWSGVFYLQKVDGAFVVLLFKLIFITFIKRSSMLAFSEVMI